MAAKAEPAGADHQLGTGERRGIGVAEQVGDELADGTGGRLLRCLDARGERRDPPSGRAGRGPASCADGLGPAATPGGGGVGQGHQPDRAVRACAA